MQNGSAAVEPNLIPTGFEAFPERAKRERSGRVALGSRRLSFGVSFLDDALGGIYPNDLIVLGAKTGLGKSQLAMLIAQHNARQGRHVHFFALEAEEFEIERRVKYQRIADKFFSRSPRPAVNLNYMDWYYGHLDAALEPIEAELAEEDDGLSTLNVYYRTGDFTVQEFERRFFAIKDATDLVIVDHLHYFDIEEENENRAMKDIVKKIRDCALISGKPIILISHVRKSDKRLKQLIPDIEDFHGSSDIGKIATKAITIAPSMDQQKGNLRQTYMHILKCRADGARTRAVAAIAFNLSRQRYEDEYYIGNLSSDGAEFNPFPHVDIPFWAKRAKGASSYGL